VGRTEKTREETEARKINLLIKQKTLLCMHPKNFNNINKLQLFENEKRKKMLCAEFGWNVNKFVIILGGFKYKMMLKN